ncbi:hypothetical protein OIU74_011954 [Salix koriyanagi]|uniref:Uncharacterized protein n=1 Tax=Salix koriyanagi TaxID=2511006 RepID=A0A9Q0Q5W2_9ROSI|nr:hypothetical protein OIU74_011954 [Salix koriyanagi]
MDKQPIFCCSTFSGMDFSTVSWYKVQPLKQTTTLTIMGETLRGNFNSSGGFHFMGLEVDGQIYCWAFGNPRSS